MAKQQTLWNERPVPQDYTAALNYLTLQFPAATARRREEGPRREGYAAHCQGSLASLKPPAATAR